MTPRIKVCGMRERYNIEAICQLPIDFIGLIFYKKSARYVEVEGVDLDYLKKEFYSKEIIPQKIAKVGVFVDEHEEEVLRIAKEYQLDYVQLHGKENVFYCKKIKEAGVKIIKAFSVDEYFSFTNLAAYEFYCDYFLFDTKGKLPGGNGFVFNWEILKKYKRDIPFFLSGGLAPGLENEIIDFKHQQLFALDLNSGFESKPGFKNVDILSEFLNKIRNALKGTKGYWG